MFLYLDYSRYINFITFLSHGAVIYMCMCVCNYIKFYECFLSLETVCVYLHVHVDVCELGTLGCVGRVG